MTRNRVPRLRRNYANAPIGTYWLPPDEFKQALRAPLTADRPTLGRMAAPPRWRNLIPALILIAVLYATSIALSALPFVPYPDGQAQIQIVLPSPAALFAARAGQHAAEYATVPVRLNLHVDGQTLFEAIYAPGELNSGQAAALFKEISLIPGEHHIRFRFENSDSASVSVFDRSVELHDRQVLILDYAAGAARLDQRRP